VSADNWAQCPRCTSVGSAKLQAHEAAIQASYGVVPVAEFDEARRALEAERDAFERRTPTFREDYEIYGAATGVVTVGYSGHCRECGLQLDFTEEHPIPDWETS